MDTENNSSLVDLNKDLKILCKNIKWIILTAIITTMIAAIAVFVVIKPKYQSTAEIIVNQKLNKDVQASEQQQIQATDLQLVNTYKSILNSETIGNAVKNSVGSAKYNQTSLSVNTDSTSQVISLDVTAKNPKLAAKVANKTAEIFKNKIKKIMNVNNVTIISKAQVNKIPVSPKKKLIILAGFFIGIIIGVMLALFGESKTIDDKEYITNELRLLDLGTISDINVKNIRRQIKH